MTTDYAEAAKLLSRAKGLLTRAERSNDIEYRKEAAKKVTTLFDAAPYWPDWWSRLTRLENDTRNMEWRQTDW